MEKDTQQLILEYYEKDKRYKVLLVILIIIAATVVGFEVFTVQNKVDQRTKEIQNQISCIGQYFTQSDRADLRIANIDDCNIIRN